MATTKKAVAKATTTKASKTHIKKVEPKKVSKKAASGKTSTTKAAPKPAAKKSPWESGKGLEVGEFVPAFELKDQNGKLVSSTGLLGSPYVLYFYPKDNTPGCTQEACDFRDHYATFGKKKAKVFGVSADSEKSHAGFVAKYSLPFPLLVDTDNAVATAFGAYGPKKLYGREFLGIIRSTFVVGKDGRLVALFRGVKVNGHVEKVLEHFS